MMIIFFIFSMVQILYNIININKIKSKNKKLLYNNIINIFNRNKKGAGYENEKVSILALYFMGCFLWNFPWVMIIIYKSC